LSFVFVHQEDGGHQGQHSQQAPGGLEGHGPDVIHAHALGHEGAAPDQCCEEQLGRALDLFFLHKITGGTIPYFSEDFKLVAIAIYFIRGIMDKHKILAAIFLRCTGFAPLVDGAGR